MKQFKRYLATLRKKFFTLSGRAGRGEFCFFVLFHIPVFFAVGLFWAVFVQGFYALFSIISGIIMNIVTVPFLVSLNKAGVLSLSVLYGAFQVPLGAVFVRRLHDLGKSGAWAALGFLPLAAIFYIIFSAQRLGLRYHPRGPLGYFRTLYDAGGTWFWVAMAILTVELVFLLIISAAPSQPGSNKYGENPQDGEEAQAVDAFI